MNIELANAPFYNGFTYFCADCHDFFSVGSEYPEKKIKYCPHCGGDDLIDSHQRLAEYCAEGGIDPIRFWPTFPPEEPLPGSRCKATPREIRTVYNAGFSAPWDNPHSFVETVHRKTQVPREAIWHILYSGAINYVEYIAEQEPAEAAE
jgi:hypothetical protein